MEKIKSKNKPNSKNNSEKKTKEKNKQDLKNKLINEIDNLILYTKGISNELILLSNTIEKDFIKDDMNNILMISKAINEMLETSINNLGNEFEKYEFLNKKRTNHEKEDKKFKINCKICEFKNKLGNTIGYNIKCEILNIKIKFGPWDNLETVKKIKNKLMGKIYELKLNENMKREKIEKFFDDFKNKIYIKYPLAQY